jgi:NADPH:quinone reductase-like Zn-dependent oxidoreductase
LKATLFRAPGGPDVLSYEDAAEPVPGPGEALVRVKASAVNRIDVWARSGRYKVSLPHILGTDIAGEVVSSDGGEGVRPGSEVVVYPVISDGTCPYCRMGSPNLCVVRGFVGVATDGGYAELVKVPSGNLIPTGGLDPKLAASMPVDFGTAWSGLVSRAKVSPGDTVLVWGAAGGLDHAAIQISKLLGADVIAAVGDDSKSEFVESLGADRVVNYASQDVVASVRSMTGGLGASVVFDHVGGETWGKSVDCLARGGRMVTLGLTSGPKSEVDVRRVYSDELSIMGTYGQSKADIEKVLGLAAEGKLRPAIFKELPLSSAKEAHQILESRAVLGKVLLIP